MPSAVTTPDSIEEFAKKMTTRARRELGATNTSFSQSQRPARSRPLLQPARPRAHRPRGDAAAPLPPDREHSRFLIGPADATGPRPLSLITTACSRCAPGCTRRKNRLHHPAQQVLIRAAMRGNREKLSPSSCTPINPVFGTIACCCSATDSSIPRRGGGELKRKDEEAEG